MISFKQFLREEEYKDWSHERNNYEIDELHEKLSNHHKYLPSQRGVIEKYTGSSEALNSNLWDSYKTKTPIDYNFAHHVDQMDSGIHENKAPHDFHVYSGTIHDPREKMNSEGILHHPAYLSTSLSHRVALGFAKELNIKSEKIANPHYDVMQKVNPDTKISKTLVNTSSYDKHLLKIKVPQGHPGAYVENFTENPREYEHILPRGLNLKHTGTDVIHGGNELHSHRTFIHHMEIVK